MRILLLLAIISNVFAADILPAQSPDTYIDKEGDTVKILDTVVRKRRRAIEEIKASHIYDKKEDEQEIEKTPTP